MADRACRNFQPNVFNKSKCQNCFKLRDAHGSSGSGQDSSLQRKNSAQKGYSRLRTVVKSGVLCITTHESVDKGRVIPSRWNKRWFVLNSTGTLDFFYYDEQKNCSTERLDGNINLDLCSGMFVGEADTGEPFSIGLKLGKSTYYLKAENRLELDNWSRVLKPVVQTSQAFIPRRPSSSSSSSESGDVFVQGPSSTSIGRVPSFGKTSVSRVSSNPLSSTPLSSSPLSTRAAVTTEEQQTSLQLEKLKDENKRLREQSVLSARQKDSAHILELELKTKVNRIKELEKEHSQCKDYQKALLFQENELLQTRANVNDLRQQVEEKDKLLQQHKGKLSIHAKELAEAKADLQEANSIIGIHRANIESLKSELSTVKHVSGSGKEKLILAGEEPESDQVFSMKADNANGHDGKDLESKLSMLMQRLKQNERELLVKTRELEKANESRSKVAKYTRSLLQELESKLSNNERKLTETENQLVNKNLELGYEKERRGKIEEENNRLFSELELLSDERKKDGLSKEVVELLNRAKERFTSENIVASSAMSVESEMTQAVPKSRGDEKRTSNGLSYVEELDRLKLALASAERASEQHEANRSDSEAVLKSANKEIDRLKDCLNEKQQDVESFKGQRNKFKDDLKKRENELDNLHKEVRKLEDRNADVVEKNRELEERLQTVESELTESMEREIFLQTENETDEGERWDVKERIVGLEEEVSIYKDKVDELEAKLSENESNSLNAEADKKRLYELERLLKCKDDELRETERNCARREKDLRKEQEAKRDEMEIELSRDKRQLEELEYQLNNAQSTLESERKKLKGRDSEFDELKRQTEVMVYREDAERHINELESELTDRDEKLFDKESSLVVANERIAECEEKLRNYEMTEKDYNSKNSVVLENRISVLQEELEESREKLAVAEERLMDYEVEEKLLSAELQKSKKEDEDFKVDEVKKKLTEAEGRIKKYEDFTKDNNSKLIASEEKVIELAEELARRLTVEQETAEWIEGVESNLSLRERELNTTRESLVSKAKELDKEKYSILDVMELSMKYIKELELAISEEKENSKELEKQLDDERSRVTLMIEEVKDLQTEGNESQETLSESLKVEEIEERLAFCERSREMEATRVKQLQTELEDSKKKFAEELNSERDSHVDEMRKLNEDTFQVSGAASSEADELKLRLTSRVITLQSDISELKASHHQELEKIRAQHKKEVESTRREAILESSVREVIQENDEEMAGRVKELETEMKDMTERYESQMELLKKSHSREMDKLKRSSGDGGDGLQTEVVQLQVEMENMSQKYMEEIENLKVHHGEELEQLKRDMAVVLQASLGAAPSPAKDDANVQQLKNRIHELEQETEELSRKYNEELTTEREKQQREIEQTRNDMMTVIQAIRSEKYADVASPRTPKELPEELTTMREDYEARIAKLQDEHQEALREAKRFRGVPLVTVEGEDESDSQLHMRVKQLESELASCREEFQKQLLQRDVKHDEEVNLLKADMLVAIQVARSGNTSPNNANQPDSQTVTNTITRAGIKLSLQEAMTKIDDLEKEVEINRKQAKKEKCDLERSLKKSEAATMFGLRRTEQMSIKIYQLQKEMESIDRKYQKEIKMYKDAFEREKEEKCKMGDWETLSSENDSLRLEIEELDLKIEETESVHGAEINMYKQKLGEEKMQNVEDLRLKIKGLEDVIEEQKLEHEKELDDLKEERDASVQELKRRHEKELENVKSEQRVLNGASGNTLVTSSDLQQKEQKIKDLELKVEEQETLLEVKRRRHKEEIKNLRQRLDDELQKHGEDVRSHRTKVRQLERRKSEHSISFGFMDDDYKRMYDEQRSENIKLKFTVEKQKKELEEMHSAMAAREEKAAEVTERRKPYAADSRRPVSDSFPLSFSYSRSPAAQDSPPSARKEPLRKAASDASASDLVWKKAPGGPVSRQTSEGGAGKHGITSTKPSSTDVGKGKTITRQISKGVESSTLGSVAARVAMYQTVATKFKDKDEKSGQRKP